MRALADTLGRCACALMRGHGFVAVGNSIAEATFRAIYTDGNARIQLQAESLGGPINFLSDAEGRLTTAGNQNAMERPWNLWKQQAKRKAEEEKRKVEEAKEAEDMRQQQVTRLKSLGASTSGPTDATQEVKGGGKPSDSYLGRLRARVKPNITFSDAQKQSIDGNPTAEVEVICSPSGQIVGMKLTQSSGVAAWDQAVLKALEKTGTLPRDENGTIPSRIPFAFRPKD